MHGDVWRGEHSTLPVLIGVDEAGRGPLAGPVSVAAVILDPALIHRREEEDSWLKILDDSKKLTEKRRLKLFPQVARDALAWSVVHVHAPHVDRVNILQATFHGMCIACEQVMGWGEEETRWKNRPEISRLSLEKAEDAQPHWYREDIDEKGIHHETHVMTWRSPELARCESPTLLIDGNKPFKAAGARAEACDQAPVVKGDALSYHIAAASILAKVSRDVVMEHCHGLWPVYGFGGHKGYPTPKHKALVAEHGPCPVHRMSFKGVKK